MVRMSPLIARSPHDGDSAQRAGCRHGEKIGATQRSLPRLIYVRFCPWHGAWISEGTGLGNSSKINSIN